MNNISFVDSTIRDAHQSLWATRMTTAMMLPIAPRMDRMGFEFIEAAVAFGAMDACIRYLREDPWERLRLLHDRIQQTPLNVNMRAQGGVYFGMMPDDVIELVVKRYATNGIRRLGLLDGLNDLRNYEVEIRTCKEIGLYVIAQLVYSIGPVFTDEYYAQKTKESIKMGVDAVLLKDPSGLLTPQRVKTLVPAMNKVAGEIPLQIHSHCPTGLAPICYLEAIARGVTIVHTASAPLANGPSLPSTEMVVKNAKRMGFDVNLDEEGLPEMADYFTELAKRNGKPLGSPAEYDLFHYEHQMPGGMITNFKSQLASLGIEHRLNEFLAEVAHVREDLGYPIMVSPCSQILGGQAALNVLHGRYEVVPEEVKKLALGYYGETPIPVKPDILDRVAKGETPVTGRPGDLIPPMVDKVREEYGPFKSDDDLVLATLFNPGMLQQYHNARRSKKTTDSISAMTPLVNLVKEVAKRKKITRLHLIEKPRKV